MKYIAVLLLNGAAFLAGQFHTSMRLYPHLKRADEMLRCYEQQSTQPITVDYYLRREGIREVLE